jgi:hypothetical protein
MGVRTFGIAAALALVASSANAWFFFLPLGAIQNAVQGGHCVSASAKVGDRINVGGKLWVVKELNGTSTRCTQYPNWPIIAKLEPYVSEAERRAEFQTCLGFGTTAGSTTIVPGIGEVVVKSVSNTGSECSDQRYPVSALVVRAEFASSSPNPNLPSDANLPAPVTQNAKSNDQPTPDAHPGVDIVKEYCVATYTHEGGDYVEGGMVGKIVGITPSAPECSGQQPNRARVRFRPSDAPKVDDIQQSAEKQDRPARAADSASANIAQKLRELNGLLKDGVITQQDYDAKKRELLQAF